MKKDLWPEINLDSSGDTPLSILMEQANILSEKTRGLILGDVLTNSKDKYIFHTFYLVAPKLNNYRYSLIDVIHSVMPYPTFIYDNNAKSDDTVKVKKISNNPTINNFNKIMASLNESYNLAPGSVEEPDIIVNSSNEFILAIESIFKSNSTVGVLNSLISQSIQNEQANKLRK
ncbi:MAG: hypothetical protein U0354_20870 [Candidatus Sericytochromatia bacterium]